MKKGYSPHWVRSKQTRKQRKYRYNAPLHKRRIMVSMHLHKALRKEYNKRSLPARKGDEVRVMRGKFSGTTGKISRVDLKALRVYVDNAKIKKVSGQEVEVSLDPSNLMITKLEFNDKRRRTFLRRKSKGETKTEVKAEKNPKEVKKQS